MHTTEIIAKAAWDALNQLVSVDLELDFDNPQLHPVLGFTRMLIDTHNLREGSNQGLIAVTAEEDTLEDVTENINLAKSLDAIEGITGILAAPQEFELRNGVVCHHGRPVSLVFMDFNNDVFLKLHRKYDLSPLIQAVKENRVLNPRGTEPINVKSMFEVITGSHSKLFHPETVKRTPWTRRFFPRSTEGPDGKPLRDLEEWTRKHWNDLVLKPERGYSGIGVKVGHVHPNADEAIDLALREGHYIVQSKVDLNLWAEDIPEVDSQSGRVGLHRRQTDFRCLFGPGTVFGFLGRFGNVPTNVGSGGGVQPLAILRTSISTSEAVHKLNQILMDLAPSDLLALKRLQQDMATKARFTYVNGPIPIALRPRLVTHSQIESLKRYCGAVWADCITLEKMWHGGELDDFIDIEEEELAIARLQPWRGGPAIFAADGLFSFGAHPEGL
jgi:hypothetical protein